MNFEIWKWSEPPKSPSSKSPPQQAVSSNHEALWWCWKGYCVVNYQTFMYMTGPKRCTGRSDNRHDPAMCSNSNWSIVSSCIFRYRYGASLCRSLFGVTLPRRVVMPAQTASPNWNRPYHIHSPTWVSMEISWGSYSNADYDSWGLQMEPKTLHFRQTPQQY